MSELPYFEIPEPPASYTFGTALGRVVDSLGFRYYWATEGLRAEDLSYKPSDDGRSTEETMVHVYHLVTMVQFVFSEDRFVMPGEDPGLSYPELRNATLMRIQSVSETLKGMPEEGVAALTIRYDVGGRHYDYSFWNAVNGPICDSLYHVGQIVAFRRTSGNPIHPKVRVFFGKKFGS